MTWAHAFRLCTGCKRKFGDEQTLQLAMLASADPIRAVCGTYVRVDTKGHKPCPQCQLRFGLKFSNDVCSMCEGTEGLD